ncbi:MAG: hypothetical protein ACLS9A_09515, partial [Clostridia bacterium]
TLPCLILSSLGTPVQEANSYFDGTPSYTIPLFTIFPFSKFNLFKSLLFSTLISKQNFKLSLYNPNSNNCPPGNLFSSITNTSAPALAA